MKHYRNIINEIPIDLKYDYSEYIEYIFIINYLISIKNKKMYSVSKQNPSMQF